MFNMNLLCFLNLSLFFPVHLVSVGGNCNIIWRLEESWLGAQAN